MRKEIEIDIKRLSNGFLLEFFTSEKQTVAVTPHGRLCVALSQILDMEIGTEINDSKIHIFFQEG